MSNAAVVQDETEDRYYTQVEAGDVRLFTLDQLDAAFNAGLIHENTYVCLEGESEWLTLGEVAGLGQDQEEEAAPVSAPQLIAQPVPQAAPQPVSQRVTQPIAHVAAQPVPRAPVAPTQPFAAQPFAAQPFGLAPSTSSVPPAPAVAAYSVPPGISPSLRPVVNDLSLDDDDDMMAMRPKRRIGKVLAGVAVLALGGLGFAVVQGGGVRLPKLDGDAAKASAASMSLASMKQAETPKPAALPAPEPVKPEPPKDEVKPAEASADTTGTDAAKKSEDDRFSEEMKAALLNKDKKQAATTKQKKASRASVAAKFKGSSKPAKGAGNFKAGGSAYDPLNGKL